MRKILPVPPGLGVFSSNFMAQKIDLKNLMATQTDFKVQRRANYNGRSTINDRRKIDNDRTTINPTDHFDRSNFY